MHGVLTAALLAAAAPATPIHDYVRSNADGSEAERILVYRPTPERVEVVKMRDHCTNAAYVIGEIDRSAGMATRLSAGRLRPGAMREEFGLLTYDPAARRIAIELFGEPPLREEMEIAPGPWHLFDFDLASLSAVLAGNPPPREFSFALPLVWNAGPPFLRNLGTVTARFEKAERHGGREAWRYSVTGSDPAFTGGPLWLDPETGIVLGARWGTPNHAEYRDFALELKTVHRGGQETWERLLTAHHRGCP